MNSFEIMNSVFETLDQPATTNGASLASIGLHCVLAQWSDQSRTDGFLPLYVVDQIGTDELFDELVAKELWTRTEDGFRIADWHEEQESEATVLARRESAGERVRRHRAKLAENRLVGEPEEIVTVAMDADLNVKESKPVPVAGAVMRRRRVTSRIPEPELQPTDTNFDEFLDLMETPPENARGCWEAWVKVNKECHSEDILNAADDYQMRVPRRQRLLPEEWLSEHEYLRCSPFNEPWEPK